MKSRVAANGMGHGLQGDARRLNGHMNDMSFGGARPRPYGNQYAYQFPDGSVNQAYMNLQNRDYEHRTRIQTAQAQMRLAAYGPGAVRGMSMGQGYEGLYPGDYGDRLVYGRPVQPPPSDLFDRSGGASGPRYGQGRYRNGSYESDAGFRDDYGGPRMRPSYSADYMGVMNGNVDWAMAAMQKAASAGGWENNDFMRLQQQQQQQQQPQAQGGRIRSDYDVPQESLRTGYQRGPEVAAGEVSENRCIHESLGLTHRNHHLQVFAYDLQRQMVGAYPRPSPAAFYGAPAPVGPAYYGDLEALPGMARIPPGMVVPPSPTSSFDRTIRPPARSGNADDITDAFASILQPVGQDELAQISSTFQNSFSLGNTVQ